MADLFRDGVRLRVEGNRLAFIDPYAVLTPDRRAAVLRREAELIDLVGWLEEASRELDLRQASIEDVSK